MVAVWILPDIIVRKKGAHDFVFVGDYCDVADLVLEMRNYECHDITDAARSISQEIPSVVSEHEGK